MCFSSQHFHPLEIKAKRMNTLIVEAHCHFKWDVTRGYVEKHLVMVIQLCKIAVFHPVNSDMGLSQSFHSKMFSEGTRGQATGCPVGTPCPWDVPLRAASATAAESPVAKPSRTGPGLSVAEVDLKGFLLSVELSACLTFFAEWGPSWL